MDQASPQCMDDDSSLVSYRHRSDELLPIVVVHFSVLPGATLTWRVDADSTLAVQGARVWLTRVSSPYDHWLAPGDEFRLQRGERVWLSTDGKAAARVSLSSLLPARRGVIARWLGRLAWLSIGTPTAR
ncbi:DUF2917 domain-containing protein [Paraburkholderia fynbosensis]|uniref:DUF2917 domain-containing protein n=1 Tax=Paraburkholderia fynbosensis TaxID=1200993 RepID=A0A6J5G2Z2_9BURK|nr:DUF2917 domain-containing protein [Paraburkholderia fynbosensis]CAB3788867.1 hypothetical protein LMG27177_02500 [Paraburkholderia fynbosensis]